MNSSITSEFWIRYAEAPVDVQRLARKSLALWRDNPRHKSLHFKKLKGRDNLWPIRVNLDWRIVGKMRDGAMEWTWIGPHAAYNRLTGGG